jgi:hypothetical protein
MIFPVFNFLNFREQNGNRLILLKSDSFFEKPISFLKVMHATVLNALVFGPCGSLVFGPVPAAPWTLVPA